MPAFVLLLSVYIQRPKHISRSLSIRWVLNSKPSPLLSHRTTRRRLQSRSHAGMQETSNVLQSLCKETHCVPVCASLPVRKLIKIPCPIYPSVVCEFAVNHLADSLLLWLARAWAWAWTLWLLWKRSSQLSSHRREKSNFECRKAKQLLSWACSTSLNSTQFHANSALLLSVVVSCSFVLQEFLSCCAAC